MLAVSLHPWLTSAYIFLWGAAPWYDLGCDGGDFEGGVDYIVDNGGIDTEADYPYLAHDDKCMCATPRPAGCLFPPRETCLMVHRRRAYARVMLQWVGASESIWRPGGQ